jgi:hypothetical protein
VLADRLRIASSAVVHGTVRYESRNAATVEDGAVVTGAIERRDPWHHLPAGGVLSWEGGAILRTGMVILAAAVILLLLPTRSAAVADHVRLEPLSTLLIGSAVAVYLPIVVFVLALSFVALPVAAIGAAGFVSAVYLSQATVGLAIGRVLLRVPSDDARRWRLLLAMACGAGLIAVVRLVPLPGVDLGVALLTAVVGLGAVVGRPARLPRQTGTVQSGNKRRGRFWRRAVAWSGGFVLGFAAIASAVVGIVASAVAVAVVAVEASLSGSGGLALSPGRLAAAGAAFLVLSCALAVVAALWHR